jgi:hypothetical protein
VRQPGLPRRLITTVGVAQQVGDAAGVRVTVHGGDGRIELRLRGNPGAQCSISRNESRQRSR